MATPGEGASRWHVIPGMGGTEASTLAQLPLRHRKAISKQTLALFSFLSSPKGMKGWRIRPGATSLPAVGSSLVWICRRLQECDVQKKKKKKRRELWKDKQERDRSQIKLEERRGKKRREVAGAREGRNERRRFTSHFSARARRTRLENSPRTQSVCLPQIMRKCETGCLWVLKLWQWLRQWVAAENWSHIPSDPSAQPVETQITAENWWFWSVWPRRSVSLSLVRTCYLHSVCGVMRVRPSLKALWSPHPKPP